MEPTVMSPTYVLRRPKALPRRASSWARAQQRVARETTIVVSTIDRHPGVTVVALWMATLAGGLLGALIQRLAG